MRELIYIHVIHPAAQEVLRLVEPKRRIKLEGIAEELAPYYDLVTEQLRAIHKKRPITRVYADSASSTMMLYGYKKGISYKPINMLRYNGAEMMVTEEGFLLSVNSALNEFLAQNPDYVKSESYPVFSAALAVDILSSWFKGSPNELRRAKTMLSGKSTLDIIALRDRAIAWNIDYTLQDDETGALIIGKLHNVDKELRKKERPTKITYVNVFPKRFRHETGSENELPV